MLRVKLLAVSVFLLIVDLLSLVYNFLSKNAEYAVIQIINCDMSGLP